MNRRPAEGILIVGSGTRFISGVSHYTRYLAVAISAHAPVSVILMRRLIPRILYPGRARVGERLTEESYPADMPVFDGIDWFWVPSVFRAARFMLQQRPAVVLFQWWTGAVLHSYLLLALLARLLGTKIIIEIHELQDTGEAKVAGAEEYVQRIGALLMGRADGFLVHSDFDRHALTASYAIKGRPVEVVRHGPYSHYTRGGVAPLRQAPDNACNYLFFGTIRPYKGLEDLVRAFEQLATEDDAPDVWLTIVGETWEGWTEPIEMVAHSPQRDQITLVNRYVTDEDAGRWFAGADVVVLPYRRSSASGPLHMTTEAGLPVVISEVGGLQEAASSYEGALLVPPRDVVRLAAAMDEARSLRGQRFIDNGSWDESARKVVALAAAISATSAK